MNYIVTRNLKSKATAALLVFLFGPLGLFYTGIYAAILMSFVIPVFIFLSVLTGLIPYVLLFMIVPIYYFSCFIWAIISVGKYNSLLLSEGKNFNSEIEVIQDSPDVKIIDSKAEVFKDLGSLKGLYEQGVLNERQYEEQKNRLTKKLEILEFNQKSTTNDVTESELSYKSNERSNAWLLILGLLLLSSMVFISYRKGWVRLYMLQLLIATKRIKRKLKM